MDIDRGGIWRACAVTCLSLQSNRARPFLLEQIFVLLGHVGSEYILVEAKLLAERIRRDVLVVRRQVGNDGFVPREALVHMSVANRDADAQLFSLSAGQDPARGCRSKHGWRRCWYAAAVSNLAYRYSVDLVRYLPKPIWETDDMSPKASGQHSLLNMARPIYPLCNNKARKTRCGTRALGHLDGPTIGYMAVGETSICRQQPPASCPGVAPSKAPRLSVHTPYAVRHCSPNHFPDKVSNMFHPMTVAITKGTCRSSIIAVPYMTN